MQRGTAAVIATRQLLDRRGGCWRILHTSSNIFRVRCCDGVTRGATTDVVRAVGSASTAEVVRAVRGAG